VAGLDGGSNNPGMFSTRHTGLLVVATLVCALAACSSDEGADQEEANDVASQDQPSAEPPARIQAWMDRLTVEHEYDPETGFIVAREVIVLPEVIASGPPVEEAIRRGQAESRSVVVFATADRCAPCQQYKKSALNDPEVIAALSRPGVLATHVEVDREPEVAETLLGSRAIPMTYLFRDGEQVAVLRGQRSSEELLAWLTEQGAQ